MRGTDTEISRAKSWGISNILKNFTKPATAWRYVLPRGHRELLDNRHMREIATTEGPCLMQLLVL